MSSYFVPEGLIASYNAPSVHGAAQFAVPPNILGTPQYPDSIAFWHNPHQPRISHSEAHHPHFQMASIPPDQRKHKRTRSGCFTCRSRRVKCDETHPVCDRCSKGKRECVYPPPQVKRTGSRANLGPSEKHPPIPESESSDENDERDAGNLKTATSGKYEAVRESRSRQLSPPKPRQKSAMSRKQSAQSLARRKARQASETSSSFREKGSSPMSDITTTTSGSQSPGGNLEMAPAELEPALQAINNIPGASNLKYDIRFFLAYHRQHITFRHYFMRQHAETFVNNDLLACAVRYEPLLYAVVGFSAYHYSVKHPRGKLYTFLQYYNQSVTGLLKSLSSGSKHDDTMLLTILQLASFEEYLGDWVSVIDHHQAAYRMLTELYTPEKINKNEFLRNTFLWYSRFDVVSGLIAGSETILSREWYVECELFSAKDVANNPSDLNKHYYFWAIRNRRYAMDMASLIAKASRGFITTEEFIRQNQDIVTDLEHIQQDLASLTNPQHLVMSYPNKVPLGPDDIVDPYVPGTIHDEPFWDINNCIVDTLGGKIMHRYQTGLLLQQLDVAELQALALEVCRILETMERWPNRPKDSIIPLQSAFGLAVIFLPRDEKHTMWCRRKLAQIEQLGYTYPTTFHTRMADIWQIPELAHWWLPNDEGYPKLIREIREWTSERASKPRDTFREDARDLKTMFWRMNVDDSSSLSTSPNTNVTSPATSVLNRDYSPSDLNP